MKLLGCVILYLAIATLSSAIAAPLSLDSRRRLMAWNDTLTRPLQVCTASINDFAARCNHGIFAAPPETVPPNGWCSPHEDYCGYDLDIWGGVAAGLGLREGVDYVHVCFGEDGFDELIADLQRLSPQGNLCDVGVTSMTATVERATGGIQFSNGIYRGSLAIMIKATIERSGTWAFFTPLSWTVWLAMLSTAFVVPFIVLTLEYIFSGRSTYRQHKGLNSMFFGLKEAAWHSMAHLLQVASFEVHSLPSRIVVLGYAFMVTIVMATYTANLAAFLTVDRLEASIRHPEDLVGQAVATTPIYVNRLRLIYRITATADYGLKFDEMKAALLAGEIKAIIADDTQLITMQRSDSSCRLYVLEDRLAPYDVAFAFANSFPEDFIDAVDEEILALQESGDLEELEAQHLPSEYRCDDATDGSELSQVSLSSLSGLWIIIAGLVGLALILAGLRVWRAARKTNESSVSQRFELMKRRLSSKHSHLAAQKSAGDAPHAAFEAGAPAADAGYGLSHGDSAHGTGLPPYAHQDPHAQPPCGFTGDRRTLAEMQGKCEDIIQVLGDARSSCDAVLQRARQAAQALDSMMVQLSS